MLSSDELKNCKDEVAICDTLKNITGEQVGALLSELPWLLEHRSWLVRVEAMEIVGFFKLQQFLPLIKKNLKHRLVTVRSWAMDTYYELLGEKAMPVIYEFANSSNLRLRVDSLALQFVETQNQACLAELAGILKRHVAKGDLLYSVFHTFEYFFETKEFPEIIGLYKSIIALNPPNPGFVTDLKKRLNEMEEHGRLGE